MRLAGRDHREAVFQRGDAAGRGLFRATLRLSSGILVAVTALTGVGFFTDRISQAVAQRAAEVLATLETSDRRTGGGSPALAELPLFAVRPQRGPPDEAAPSPAEAALAGINPDELTPKAALEILYKLKELSALDRR